MECTLLERTQKRAEAQACWPKGFGFSAEFSDPNHLRSVKTGALGVRCAEPLGRGNES